MKQRRCKDCHEWSDVPWEGEDDLFDYTVYCEDCGEHTAAKCPKCGELADLVLDREGEWRDKVEPNGN